MTSSLQISTSVGAISSASASIVVTPPSVRLDAGNFMLWKGLILPNIAGAGLSGYLDGTEVPVKTIKKGEGDAAVEEPNPAYATWWVVDQKVLGYLLGSMEPDVAGQLIGCKSAAAAWTAVHTMFGAQSRANVRHIRRQLQSLRKESMSAAQYMHKMKSFADCMAEAGSPISDDELVDYIITGLGTEFNPIAASLTVGNNSVTYSDFYSHILSFEALQAQQLQSAEWTSSANAASRPGPFNTSGRPRPPEYPPAQYGGGRPAGPQQGQGRPYDGGNDRQYNGGYSGGGGGNRPNAAQQTGGNGRNGKKQRPRCQICGYWGHEAFDCRNRFNHDFRINNNQRSGNAASMSSVNSSHWLMDTGATDHLTSDLERLHTHERYGGKDHVQVANGTGLSISHIGHSNLAGSSLRLNNILHVPHIRQNLLSVYRLVSDNDVFVEFHRYFFCVKDKATRRILLHGRSQDGLYPIPYSRASSSSRQACSSVKVTSSQWHQRLGHPSNNVVQTIVKHHDLPLLPSPNSVLVCDACQRAKSHQLPYTASHRVSTAPLELIHSDVWGPAIASSGGYKYYVSFVDD